VGTTWLVEVALAGDEGSPVHGCCLQTDGEARALVSDLCRSDQSPVGAGREDKRFRI